MYSLSKPADWYRPVVMPVFQKDSDAVDSLLAQLKHIAQWHFMLDLRNETDTRIPPDLLEIEITDAQGNLLPLKAGVVEPPLRQSGTLDNIPVYNTPIKVRLTNNGTHDLYVAPILMMDYGCLINLMSNPDSSRPIEPGNFEELEINLSGRKTTSIPLGLDDTARLFNQEKNSSFLKFIISLAPINGSSKLDLNPLPLPYGLSTMNRSNKDAAKGSVMVDTQTQTMPEGGWNAVNVDVRTKNPLYNTLDKDGIDLLLAKYAQNAPLLHFLKEIYP